MKKIIITAMLLMGMSYSVLAQTEDFHIDSYTYGNAYLKADDGNSNFVILKHFEDAPSQMVIPKKVTYNGITYEVMGVDRNAFNDNTSIKTLCIPDSFEVKSSAFEGAKNLEEIILGDCCDLRSGCFRYCPSIKKVYITGKLYRVRKNSFLWSEENLKQRGFYLVSSIPPKVVGEELDESVYKQVTLYVPTNSIGKYKGDSFWGKFKISGWDAKAFIENRLKRE